MKIIENSPDSPESLQQWYSLPNTIPITAVQRYIYVVSEHDLKQWVKKTYPALENQFYECLGVNTRIEEGTYLTDIGDAVRRMNGKPTLWD